MEGREPHLQEAHPDIRPSHIHEKDDPPDSHETNSTSKSAHGVIWSSNRKAVFFGQFANNQTLIG